MSTFFKIKDGIIVSRFAVDYDKEVEVNTLGEWRALHRASKLNKKIKEAEERAAQLKKEQEEGQPDLREEYTTAVERIFRELAATAHETYIPGQVHSLMEEWQRASAALSGEPEAYAAQAAEILRKGRALQRDIRRKEQEVLEGQIDAMEQIAAMWEDLDALEGMVFNVDVAEGAEKLDAEIDLRTGGKMARIRAELEEIEERIDASGPAELRKDRERLEELKGELAGLPQEAREVFTVQLWRQEQAQLVADRLVAGGWEIVEVSEGDGLFDDTCLMVKNARGQRALISFTIQGEVDIHSFFEEDAGQTRAGLQQLVLGALKAGGAKGAAGACMDQEREKGPERIQEPTAANRWADDPSGPARGVVRQTAATEKEERRGQR